MLERPTPTPTELPNAEDLGRRPELPNAEDQSWLSGNRRISVELSLETRSKAMIEDIEDDEIQGNDRRHRR
jgi:hypothetical protein